MAWLPTPKALSIRAECYHQLAQAMHAGLTLIQAFESFERMRAFGVYRRAFRKWRELLEQGYTLSEALGAVRSPLPEFDRSLLDAGERSGRLDPVLKSLASYYQQRAADLRKAWGLTSYPLFVLHAAAFLIPFPAFFQTGDLGLYLRSAGGVLVPIYILGLGGFWAMSEHRPAKWRFFMESITRWIPIWSQGRRAIALSRLCLTLESALNAGISMGPAWALAARTSGSALLEREIRHYPDHIDAGETPGELMQGSRVIPDLFQMSYRNGELSGRLDENIRRLRDIYDEEGARCMRALATWIPRLLYFILILVLANYIVNFWLGYYNGLLSGD